MEVASLHTRGSLGESLPQYTAMEGYFGPFRPLLVCSRRRTGLWKSETSGHYSVLMATLWFTLAEGAVRLWSPPPSPPSGALTTKRPGASFPEVLPSSQFFPQIFLHRGQAGLMWGQDVVPAAAGKGGVSAALGPSPSLCSKTLSWKTWWVGIPANGVYPGPMPRLRGLPQRPRQARAGWGHVKRT